MTATAAGFAVAASLAGRPLDPSSVPASAWPGIVAVAFVASFLAIQTFYAGARRIGAARAALTATVEPLIIVGLARIFLGQTLAPIQLAGAALILIGVVVAQTSPRPRGAPEPATPSKRNARSARTGSRRRRARRARLVRGPAGAAAILARRVDPWRLRRQGPPIRAVRKPGGTDPRRDRPT
ncbi:MAG: DMT family transporter [Candidatus Limnocylindrales bacterium]